MTRIERSVDTHQEGGLELRETLKGILESHGKPYSKWWKKLLLGPTPFVVRTLGETTGGHKVRLLIRPLSEAEAGGRTDLIGVSRALIKKGGLGMEYLEIFTVGKESGELYSTPTTFGGRLPLKGSVPIERDFQPAIISEIENWLREASLV